MDKEWYFIGLWLGDGAKDATSITTADIEITDYLKELADKYKLNISLYKKEGNTTYEVNISAPPFTKQVYKYSLNEEYIESYNSIKEAAKCNNIKYTSNITAAAKGISQNCGGFKWKYGETKFNNILRESLKSLNLINNKHIPIEIYSESKENKKAFLAGLIDSDGTMNYQTIGISQKDYIFIMDLKYLCSTLGYKTRIQDTIIKYQSYHNLWIKGDLRDIPVLLDRKRPTKISRINKAMEEYYN